MLNVLLAFLEREADSLLCKEKRNWENQGWIIKPNKGLVFKMTTLPGTVLTGGAMMLKMHDGNSMTSLFCTIGFRTKLKELSVGIGAVALPAWTKGQGHRTLRIYAPISGKSHEPPQQNIHTSIVHSENRATPGPGMQETCYRAHGSKVYELKLSPWAISWFNFREACYFLNHWEKWSRAEEWVGLVALES